MNAAVSHREVEHEVQGAFWLVQERPEEALFPDSRGWAVAAASKL